MVANSNNVGKFITFEYLDGGRARPFIKSIVAEFFPSKASVIEEKEPTNGLFSQPLRTVLSEDWEEEIHWRELVYGFLADRQHHNEKRRGIKNLLKQGKTVICDRYNLSTYAYQLPSEKYFDWYYDCCEDLLVPNLTIFLKYDVETCVNRALGASSSSDDTEDDEEERSLLSRKTRSQRDELKQEILQTEVMYLKAIEFLRKKIPPHNIEIVEAKDFTGTWYRLRPIIEKCLKSSSS